jgi:hypothetical protein
VHELEVAVGFDTEDAERQASKLGVLAGRHDRARETARIHSG